MATKIQSFFIGTGGILGSEVTANVVKSIDFPIHDWASAITQVVIAVATLFGLFRKRSKR